MHVLKIVFPSVRKWKFCEISLTVRQYQLEAVPYSWWGSVVFGTPFMSIIVRVIRKLIYEEFRMILLMALLLANNSSCFETFLPAKSNLNLQKCAISSFGVNKQLILYGCM